MTGNDVPPGRPGVVEVVEETATIHTREVVNARVRVTTRTELHDEVLRQDLHGTRLDLVSVPVDRMLEPGETPALARTEGGVTIIPIYEEVVVTEKRIVLKEELHVVQHEITEEIEIPVTLRKQVATIERLTSED